MENKSVNVFIPREIYQEWKGEITKIGITIKNRILELIKEDLKTLKK